MRRIPSVCWLILGLSIATANAQTAKRIDPAALSSLKRMSETLRSADALTYRAQTIFEVPAKTGQFITMFSDGKVALKRPDRLLAEMRGSAPHFDFYYNGETVSAFAPGPNVYSTQPAPGTIDAMLSGLEAETGIRFASAPLLYSDPYAVLTKGLTSGVVVGPTRVDGVLCNHLAFRSPGVNWEIWIQANGAAVPRRMAVTFTDRTNFPRTVVEFSHWNLSPWFLPDSDFSFQPPAGAQEIPFASVLKSADR